MRLTKKQQEQIKNISTEDRKKIQEKFKLNKIPGDADIEEYLVTQSFAQGLYGPAKNQDTTKSNVTSSPQQARDQYIENYVGALYSQFDAQTNLQLQEFSDTRDDLETSMSQYREDFARITSRQNKDYFTGVALQNKEFSKSLDYIANAASRSIGSLKGVGASRITDSTNDKIENDARIKLNFDRSVEDRNIDKQRQEARYKLSSTRLARNEKNYQDSRSTEKKVLGINAASSITEQYNDNITNSYLQETSADGFRKNISGGGSKVENIFDY